MTPQSYEPEWIEYLLAARRGGVRRSSLSPGGIPIEAGYAAQDALVRRLGAVSGWKVGAASLEATPTRSAIVSSTIQQSPGTLNSSGMTIIGLEAELAFRLSRALPVRQISYSREEVLSSIGTVHAALEVIDTRYSAWGIADRGSQLADQLNHAALIVSEGVPFDSAIDWSLQPFALKVNGEQVRAGIGGNTAVDPTRLVQWLANDGAHSLGGLQEGSTITTGSCSGALFVAPRSTVAAGFPGVGEARLTLSESASR